MTSFFKKSLILGGVSVLAIIGSVMNPGRDGLIGSAQAGNPQDVNIVSPLPLTVKGTVSAAQSGAWSVGITGTPSVSLTNTGSSPVPMYNVDSPGRIPFQKLSNKSGQCAGLTNCDFTFGTVPAGHRLVVQHITGVGQLNGPPVKVSVYAPNNSGYPVMQFFAPFVDAQIQFDNTTLFYLDGGTNIYVTMAAGPQTFAGGNLAQFVTLTGYLVDCTIASCAAIVQ